jgi:hypothetical protein
VYEDVDGCGRGGRRGRFVIIWDDIVTSCSSSQKTMLYFRAGVELINASVLVR